MKLKTTTSSKEIIAALKSAADRITNADGHIAVEVVNGSVGRIALPGITLQLQNYSVCVQIPATKKVRKFRSAIEFVGNKLAGEFDTELDRRDWEDKIRAGLSTGDHLEFEREDLEVEVIEEDET